MRNAATTTTIPKVLDKDLKDNNQNEDDDSISAWEVLAGNIANCLVQSDLKRDSGFDGSSTGWTSWVEASSAFRLQKCMDKLVFMDITTQEDNNRIFNLTTDQDDLVRWLKWIKSSPAPMIVELSEPLRAAVNATITEKSLEQVEQTSEVFLSRIACRLILLPSGKSLQNNIRTEAGAMVYGKQLYGGATRYRVIGSQQQKRKAGERMVIASQGEAQDAWMQYGGPERNYDALDMGPCALMELTILPKGLTVPELEETKENHEMYILQGKCNPALLFDFPSNATATLPSDTLDFESSEDEIAHHGSEYLPRLQSRFTSVLGGLTTEIEAIVRRVLDGRATTQSLGSADDRAEEMKMMLELGLHPVRGLLLYGPPGCGKTALAREISRLLTERPPKIVSAPELLDRWVGGSEKLVRDLFGDAETELKMCNGDLTKSGLHVIVIDEIDAVFRKRSSAPDSGEVARASAVNQILAKLDGVNALGNVLLIATTNRPELLDEALLRPGRLEVQVEVPLPDKVGRREILQIHFDALRTRGRLSKPLCEAIDGVGGETSELATKRKLSLAFTSLAERRRSIKDLAADKWTEGFSGADLQGLVRCAGSIALSRARRDGNGVDGLLITVEDVRQALNEVR
jgi:vesicle-fusing ATPase